jgi:Holliday junction resolvasome RuvABC endonuclease subunit
MYKIIKNDMTKFEENNPERLKEFIKQLRILVDEFHPNIYTIDKVFLGLEIIENSISDKLNK